MFLRVFSYFTKHGWRWHLGRSWYFSCTGYRAVKDRLLLLDAIHLAFNHPEYQPKNGSTFCNQYINEVCETYGFKELSGKLANDIFYFLSTHPQWIEVSMEKCQEMANEGTLIIAGIRGTPHGHVAVICPGKEKTSGRWGKVPSCSSVGKVNEIGRGINWCFSSLPRFFAWRETL